VHRGPSNLDEQTTNIGTIFAKSESPTWDDSGRSDSLAQPRTFVRIRANVRPR